MQFLSWVALLTGVLFLLLAPLLVLDTLRLQDKIDARINTQLSQQQSQLSQWQNQLSQSTDLNQLGMFSTILRDQTLLHFDTSTRHKDLPI